MTYIYQIYPSSNQAQALAGQLGEACRLHNAALQERRDAYRQARASLSYCDLANFSCSQEVLRVDKTFKSFFRRLRRNETPGYSRFKSRSRYHSLTFPLYGDGCRLWENGRLYLQRVGEIKVKLQRPVTGRIKTVTAKRQAGRWSASVSTPTTQRMRHFTTTLGLTLA